MQAAIVKSDGGERCRKGPTGRIRLSAKGIINDTGEPDRVASGAQQHPVEDLPEEGVSGYLERQYPEILIEFRAIVAAMSLEESGSGVSEEPAFAD